MLTINGYYDIDKMEICVLSSNQIISMKNLRLTNFCKDFNLFRPTVNYTTINNEQYISR